MQKFDGLNGERLQQGLENLESQKRTKIEEALKNGGGYTEYNGAVDKTNEIRSDFNAKKQALQDNYNADKAAAGDIASQTAIQEAKSSGAITSSAMEKQQQVIANSKVLGFSQSSADVSSAYSTGIMSNGMVTSTGMSTMVMNSMQQQHKMLAMNDTFGNTPQQKQALNEFMNNVGLSALEKQSVLSAGSPAERANRFLSYTRANSLQGSYQGRSFNATLSTDGQFNGKFDSSVNFVGGYRSDMGEAWTYQMYRAYGVEGAKNWGTTKTVYNGVMDTIGTVGEVASLVRGGGKLGGIRKAFKGSPSQTGNAGGIVENGVGTYGK